MSSANKRKSGSLEDSFRHRMQDAEATPAPDLWDRIDHDLTVQENVQFKKRAVFYRQLAAACFILFALAGTVLIYQFNTSSVNNDLALQEVTSSTEDKTIASTAESLALSAESKPTSPETADNQVKPAIATAPATNENITSGTGAKSERAYTSRPSKTENQIAATATGISSAVAGSDKRSNVPASPATLNVADKTITEQIALTTPIETPAVQTGEVLKPSFLLQSPSVLSLMAKDQQNATDFLAQDKSGTKQLAKDLAQELNAANKSGGDKTDESATADSRWSMSMAYMPTYFAQNIGLPDQMMNKISANSFARGGPSISAEASANMEKAKDEYENNTTPAFSYAVDVKAGFKVGKKLRLLAGFGYSQNTTRTNTSYIVEQFWNNPRTNAKVELTPSTIFLPSLNNSFTTDSISVTATSPFNVDYRYRMVSFPVGLQYEHELRNGWDLYMTGGVAANVLMKSSVTSSRKDILSVSYDQNDESPFRNTHFSGNVGLGVNKQVSDFISISVGPEFKSFFNTMLAEPDRAVATQGKPYSIGLNMSLIYQLGNSKK